MESPTNIQATDHQPRLSLTALSTRVTGEERADPRQIWDLLKPEQQQTMFQTLVLVCRSLLSRSTRSGGEGETDDVHP